MEFLEHLGKFVTINGWLDSLHIVVCCGIIVIGFCFVLDRKYSKEAETTRRKNDGDIATERDRIRADLIKHKLTLEAEERLQINQQKLEFLEDRRNGHNRSEQ